VSQNCLDNRHKKSLRYDMADYVVDITHMLIHSGLRH
jgi:hypothetical protein